MKMWTIKKKGKITPMNTILKINELLLANGESIFANYLFYTKKDAMKYLELHKHEGYEAVGMVMDNLHYGKIGITNG